LTLFARHYAWLHTKPSKQDSTRFAQFSSDEENPSPLLEMPKIEFGQYLLDYAFEIGPSNSGSDGPTIITWTDVKDWSDLVKVNLDMWEILVIREISKAFVAQYYMSQGSTVPSPYQPVEIDKVKASSRIGGLLRSIAKRKVESR
jgi:hypothetical protein